MQRSGFALMLSLAAIVAAEPTPSPTETSRRALELYRQGNCKEATPLLERILATQPSQVTVRKMYADCLGKQGQKAQSAAQYRQVLREAPGDKGSRTMVTPAAAPAPAKPPVAANPETVSDWALSGGKLTGAERLIKAGKLDDAEKSLLALIGKMPRLTVPRLRLAEIYSGSKRHVQAAKVYGELSQMHPDEPDYLLRQAQNLAWSEKYAESAEAYRAYLAKAGSDPEAMLGLANILFWSNRLPEAVKAYRDYLRVKPDDTAARLNLGNSLLWTKSFRPALDELRQVAAKKPGDTAVEMGIAQCYEQLEQYGQALAIYDRVAIADPANKDARVARDRVSSRQVIQRAQVLGEKKDYEAAARQYLAYLERNPGNEEILLEVARVYSWAKRYQDSVKFYRAYLDRAKPNEDVLRELARVEMSAPDFASARLHYASLIKSPKATSEDYEGLVNSYLWDGKTEEAQTHARRLLEIEADNPVALAAIKSFGDRGKTSAVARAQKLASSGAFRDAIDAYRAIADKYGADREMELALARLYAWDKQTPKAIQAFEEYLQRYPKDSDARAELGRLKMWKGDYREAEREYRASLAAGGNQPRTLLGLAQVSDERGADRFTVARQYREVLRGDPSNETARQKLNDLIPDVSPSLQAQHQNFTDSDHFSRNTTTMEGSLPMAGGLRISTYLRTTALSQSRQVGGAECGADPSSTDARAQRISSGICGGGGLRGVGGGVRLQQSLGDTVTASFELNSLHYASVQWTSINGQAEIAYRPSQNTAVSFSLARRDAMYDLNTLASQIAGIQGDHISLSLQQTLSDKWSLWLTGGMSRYSSGRLGEFERDTQRRIGGRLAYRVFPSMSAGYYMRMSSFDNFNPLYFSPKFYGTYGVFYSWNKMLSPGLRLVGDMEMGYGRISRYDKPTVNNLELAALPALEWKLRPDVWLHMGYRYGRGRSSSFGSPVYSTHGFELGLRGFLSQPTPTMSPNRVEIQ
jgi:tetratricopeptide (TPR) repeat protein